MLEVEQAYSCLECPLQNCSGLRQLTPARRAAIQQFKLGEVIVPANEDVLRQGEFSTNLFTVLDGVLIRYRRLEDNRRQIVNFMFPGDLIGLQGSFDEPNTHSVEALLPSRLCKFERNAFHDIVTEQPQLSYDLIWVAAKEETALEEHLVAVGQRSSKERVTYLAVWLLDRAIATGMVDERNELRLPIRQGQIADMLGMSLVHTNRTLRALERDQMVEWSPGHIRIPDLDKAYDFAHFERSPAKPRPYI